MRLMISHILVLCFLLQSFSAFADEPISIEQKRKNVLLAQHTLKSCVIDEDDSRKIIDRISRAMVGNCALDPVEDKTFEFLELYTNVKAIPALMTESKDEANMKNFVQALRMKTIKNAMMTYLDAEHRYHRNYPDPHKYASVGKVVHDFCVDKKSKYVCSNEEAADLAKLVVDYRKQLEKNVTPLNLLQVKRELNEKLEILDKALIPVKVAREKLKEVTVHKNTSTIAPSDQISAQINYLERPLKIQAEAAFVEPERQKYLAQYLNEASSGVGLLLYSKTLREKMPPGKRQVNLLMVKEGISEILFQTRKLAIDTNNQFFNKEFAVDGNEEFENMILTNPIAAGQVLAEHPEFAREACQLIKEISAEDERRRFVATALEKVAYGSMIVGGVLIASGYLAPVGVEVEAISATLTATVEFINIGLTYASIFGDWGYNYLKQWEIHQDIEFNQTSLLAGTGGDYLELRALEKEYLENRKGIIQTVLLAVGPLATVHAIKILRKAKFVDKSKALRLVDKYAEKFSTDPLILANLRAVSFGCALMKEIPCQIFFAHFALLKKQKQKEVLRDKSKIARMMDNAIKESKKLKQKLSK